MKSKNTLFLLLILLLALSGCRTARRAQREQQNPIPVPPHIQSPTTPRQPERKTSVDALSARMSLRLESGSKGVTCGGTCRVKRGEVVQLNLVYTLLVMPIHVGTLELTPDSILLVDRVNRRYCRAAYADVPQLRRAGIGFDTLERAFWGDEAPQGNSALTFAYEAWAALSRGQFPTQTTLAIQSGSRKAKATLSLSDLEETDRWARPTQVNSKYEAVSLDAVMAAILSLAQ